MKMFRLLPMTYKKEYIVYFCVNLWTLETDKSAVSGTSNSFPAILALCLRSDTGVLVSDDPAILELSPPFDAVSTKSFPFHINGKLELEKIYCDRMA